MATFGQLLYRVEVRILAALFLTLRVRGHLPNKRAGFYCDSEHLNQRVVEPNTVSDAVLLVVSIGSTILMVVGTESVLAFYSEQGKLTIGRWWNRVKRPFNVLVLTFIYSEAVTEFLKILCGMPRPHFFHTCRPNFHELDCSQYVTDYKCTSGASEHVIIDAQQSFPSAHASFSATAAVAMVWYVTSRFILKKNVTEAGNGRSLARIWRWAWPRLLCLASVCWAFFCGWSRIQDRRHHWWDVATGCCSGSFVAFCTISLDPWRSWAPGYNYEDDDDESEVIDSASESSGRSNGSGSSASHSRAVNRSSIKIAAGVKSS